MNVGQAFLAACNAPIDRLVSRIEEHNPWYGPYKNLIILVGPYAFRHSDDPPRPDDDELTAALDALAAYIPWRIDWNPAVRNALIERARNEGRMLPQVKNDALRAALREALETLIERQFQRTKEKWLKDERGERLAFIPLELHPRLAPRFWHSLWHAAIRIAEADLLGGTFSLQLIPPPGLTDALAAQAWAEEYVGESAPPALLAVWEALPDDNKIILSLSGRGFTSREIGARLGLKPPAVRQRKKTILNLFRAALSA